jgi:hypothetical protein
LLRWKAQKILTKDRPGRAASRCTNLRSSSPWQSSATAPHVCLSWLPV